MDNDQYLPADAEAYIDCVRRLSALINKAISEAEKTGFVSEADKSQALQRLADGVETVACLRGDSGIFHAGRPDGLERHQKEMYQIEDNLRAKLVSLGYTYPQR